MTDKQFTWLKKELRFLFFFVGYCWLSLSTSLEFSGQIETLHDVLEVIWMLTPPFAGMVAAGMFLYKLFKK